MKTYLIKITHPTNLRLDQFLAEKKIAPSRSQIHRWIQEGHVTVNEMTVRPSTKLSMGDVIKVSPPEIKKNLLIPQKIPLDILYEDSDIVVLNKSADMVVHPGAGHHDGTLTHALLSHCGELSIIGGVERPGIVHRLDKGTSGVMVIAKNDKTHLELSRQFKNHEVKKIYWALVYGCPKNKTGVIATKISRSPLHRKKFAVSLQKGKQAVTHYSVLKKGEGVSLLELRLETGRTHQIRVHLTHQGHSIVGDSLYGGNSKRLKQIQDLKVRSMIQNLDHTLLHAHTLGFTHPVTGKEISFTAPLPGDFSELIEACF